MTVAECAGKYTWIVEQSEQAHCVTVIDQHNSQSSQCHRGTFVFGDWHVHRECKSLVVLHDQTDDVMHQLRFHVLQDWQHHHQEL
jgi:hypothetical protein